MLLHHEMKSHVDVVREYGQIPTVSCNTGQINQVFLNVLVNAAQAIEEKGTISIRTSAVGGFVQVKIGDTGVGIPAEALGRIFEMGFTTKRVGLGTGLGLAICKQIVNEHNGQIDMESQPGVGTTVTIRLPIDREGRGHEDAVPGSAGPDSGSD
jgi:signal transduction histidine kinase